MSDKKMETVPKKKSFWDKMKSIALEEEVSTADEGTTTSSSSATPTTHTSKFVYSDVKSAVQVIPAFSKGQFDEKLFNGFIQHMEEKNLEGVDYLEFSKAKKGMDSILGMSEQIKYQSAFASLRANSSITKEHLIETADFYIKELDSQKTEFDLDMQKELEYEVVMRKKDIESKNLEIVAKQEEMTKIQLQINDLQVEIGALNNDAAISESNIKATENNFNVTLEVVKAQILQDKENIKTFIN